MVGPRRLSGLPVALVGGAVVGLVVQLAGLPGAGRAAGLAAAAPLGPRVAGHLVVAGSATVGAGRPRAARGSRGTVGRNPPRVRHDGLLRGRTAAVGRLGAWPLGSRAPAVCLDPPRPRPDYVRLRCLVGAWPWAVRGGVARSGPGRSGREPGPRGHAALGSGAGRPRWHVSRAGPIAGASRVAGINRVGAGVQSGVEQGGVLRVAFTPAVRGLGGAAVSALCGAAVAGLGGPATRATVWAGRGERAALTIHPVPPAWSPRSALASLRHSPRQRV